MTSQQDQIQALIAEIDTVLQKTSPRLPWVMSGEATQQRQVLERVRNYLVAFQTRQGAGTIGQLDPRSDLLAHDIYYREPSSPPMETTAGWGQPDEVTPQQMLQAVMQEMSYLRTSLMQPLRTDLESLRQQRDALTQEIQQLEAQRRHYELGQSAINQQQLVNDFLQILMGRLQESLAQQVAQTLESLRHQALPATNNPLLTGGSESSPALTPQLEQLQALQARSDQLLVGLDSSLRVVFESLQQSIQAYQESLTQGVDRLHTLGQQGEVMVNALLNHLAQRLGQEASSYLQSSAQQFAGLETNSIDSLLAFPAASPPTSPPPPEVATPEFPYPGIELPPPNGSVEPTPVDAAIESWLQSVSAANQPDLPDLGESSLAALDLSQVELGQVDVSNLDALLSLDLNLTDENAVGSTELFSPDALTDLPTISTEAETALEGVAAPLAEAELGGVTEEDTEDIDAALKLLEQLSQELQDQTQTGSIAAAEATLDRILAPSPATETLPEQPTHLPEDARDELDEFYESFFGRETVTPPELESSLPEPPIGEQAGETEIPEFLATEAGLEFPEFEAADVMSSLPDLGVDSDLLLNDDLFELSLEPESSLEDVLFGTPTPEASPIEDLPTPEREPEPDLPEAQVVDTPVAPEAPPEAWLPEPNFLDSFFDEQDAIARSESVAALEIDLESADLATLEVETEVPEQVGSLTELTELLFEPSQPSIAEPLPEMSSGDRPPAITDLPTGTSLDLEINLPVGQGLAASEPRSSDDVYILAAPEEDLLPTNSLDDDLDFNLDLDEALLNRLSADLSNLEAMADQATQLLGSDSSEENFGLTLDDWTIAAPVTPKPEADPSEAGWQEASLQEFADSLPEAQTEVEPEISYAELSLEDFATVLPEVPTADEPSLEEFGMAIAEPEPSLEEFAAAVPVAPLSESEPSLEEFGMALEEASSEASWQEESLEELAVAIPESPIAATPAFTLEGMNDLFGDAEPVDSPPALVTPVVPQEPLPFTLEGMDSLFEDVPAIAASTEPTAPVVTPEVPEPAPAVDSPFTQENIENLFNRNQSSGSSSLRFAKTTPSQPPFTLAGMDGLFENAPAVESTQVNPISEPTPSTPDEPPSSYVPTLERIDHLFDEVISRSTEASGTTQTDPLAGSIEDLFGDAPPVATPIAPETSEALPASEPLAEMDDLFRQPTELTPVPVDPLSPTVEELAAFTLEGMDDLFVEPPTKTAPANNTAVVDALTLDEAFESLLGLPAEPGATSPPEANPSAPEKKKKTR
ncbi:hypothetical protein ACN4EK_27790 [Pantanalinema rosaneae CENA516]|uniref:hypothetical protein n=1 Tax=Pantanalinema rosaneae TaxID=1620701 RepID=UPI003D6FA206